MTAGLNLDAVEPDGDSTETFTLAGREWHCRSADDVRPGVVAQLFTRRETATIAEITGQVGTIFHALIAESEWPEFEVMMNDEDSPLTKKRADLLIPYLIEKVLGIPTAPPKSSPAGRPTRNTSSKSRAGSSSRATRRKAS